MKVKRLSLLLLAVLFFGCKDEVILERPLGVDILENGDLLVTDGGGLYRWDNTGSKVFIIGRNKKIKWVYDEGLAFAHSAIMLKNGNILIPDTNNNRLIEVNMDKDIVWSSDNWKDGLLHDGSHLDYPNHVEELDNGNFLLSDRDNNRVIEFNRGGEIFRKICLTSRQHGPVPLKNGNILIADSEANRIIEVDASGEIVWSFSSGLKWPRYAERLDNGNTVITDSRNHRVIEVTSSGEIIHQYKSALGTPYQAKVLDNGNILISDAQHSRVVELDKNNNVIWEFINAVLPEYPETPNDLDMEYAGTSDSNWYIADMIAHDLGTWEVDTTKSYRGNQSLRISTDSNKRPTKRWWGQRISVTSGDKINIFCKISTELTKGSAGISISWKDAKGGNIGGVDSKHVSGISDWTTVTLQAKAPPEAVTAEISLAMIGKGSAWFDSMEFGKI